MLLLLQLIPPVGSCYWWRGDEETVGCLKGAINLHIRRSFLMFASLSADRSLSDIFPPSTCEVWKAVKREGTNYTSSIWRFWCVLTDLSVAAGRATGRWLSSLRGWNLLWQLDGNVHILFNFYPTGGGAWGTVKSVGLSVRHSGVAWDTCRLTGLPWPCF